MKYKEYLSVSDPIFENINELEQIFNELRMNVLDNLNKVNKIKLKLKI